MAEIVKARDTEGNRIVAVKRILPHLLEDQQFTTMFLDESRVLTKLEHEFICRAFEVGQVEGTPYIALEYVEGQDARMVFHRSRRDDHRVPLQVGCYIIAQVCSGLHFAHEQTDESGQRLGLVHRDVSLQNVLIGYDGEVKITDFGIAMSAENQSRTEAGIVKGKFGYMAPEQIRGRPLDRRSDVFAAGICLYEMLTSERLFSGETDYAAVEKVRNVDIQPPSTLNRQIPSALEKIVMKALSKEPKDRYQNAMEMRDALRDFMSSSHNECTADDLGAYLRDMFREERAAADNSAKTTIKDSAIVKAAMAGAAAADEGTGLAAFDDLDQVSSVSELAPSPVDEPSDELEAVQAEDVQQIEPAPRPHVATHQGMPGPRAAAVSHHSVPPLVPRDASIPQGYGPRPAVQQRGLEMEWDDDEPPTQSMGMEELEELPDPGVAEPLMLTDTSAGGLGAAAPVPIAGALPLAGGSIPPPGQSIAPPGQSELPLGPVLGAVVGLVVVIVAFVVLLGEAKPGIIHLTTTPPDAIVTVGGDRVPASSSPFVIDSLPPGTPHEIVVEKAGYKPWRTTLSVKAGATMTLPPVMLQRVAPPPPPVAVTPTPPPPPAPVEVKQPAPRVEQPPKAPPSTKPKTRTPRKPTYADTTRKRTKNPPVVGKGTLRINTRPWSQVFVDGRLRGNTPQMNIQLPAGKHRVKLVNPQFGLRKTITVTIQPGKVVTKVLTLQ